MIADGILVKGSSSSVYYIEDGKKRPVADDRSFNYYKFKWNRVIHAPDSFVNAYPDGRIISRTPPFRLNSPGTLLVNGKTIRGVFLLHRDILYGFHTQQIFERFKYRFDDVLTLPDAIILFMRKGHEITSPFVAGKPLPGKLFKGPDQQFYYSDNGVLRRVADEKTKMFYKWNEADAIPLTKQQWLRAEKGEVIDIGRT